MCRHFAWLGAPRTVGALMLDPPHGLRQQSFAPRRQAFGRINADGWGVGLFSAEPDLPDGSSFPDGARPVRWRSNRPLWSDRSFADIAPILTSTCVLGAVRSASVGMPLDETASAPFTDGRWLVSHNGRVDRAVIGPHPAAESMCDAAILAARLFDAGPADLGRFVVDVGTRDPQARLNLLATDGASILATTWGDTLSVRRADDGVLVASEPFDDDAGWVDVPPRHLVRVSGPALSDLSIEITALEPS